MLDFSGLLKVRERDRGEKKRDDCTCADHSWGCLRIARAAFCLLRKMIIVANVFPVTGEFLRPNFRFLTPSTEVLPFYEWG